MSSPRIQHVRHAIWAASVAVAVTAMIAPAWAQRQPQGQTQAKDDEDDIENHILNADKRLLNALGLGSAPEPTIYYRERSPLVVPQGRDLPVPGKAVRTGDWPVEAEVKAKREAAALRKAGKDPASLDPAKPISGTAEAKKTGYNGVWAEGPKSKEEPGFFTMLMEGKLKGTWAENETGKFEGEPPRTSLIDPPTGYLTPSPAAPYGVTPRAGEVEKKEPKL